jgi:hypothetical protein
MFQFCFRPWAADIRKLIGHMCENLTSTGLSVPCGKPPARSAAVRRQTRNYPYRADNSLGRRAGRKPESRRRYTAVLVA